MIPKYQDVSLIQTWVNTSWDLLDLTKFKKKRKKLTIWFQFGTKYKESSFFCKRF